MLTKQRLIEDNMNLVYHLISREYPTYIQDEDLIQCGMLGLCCAAEKWDESKSAFSTFATYCIRNEIRMEFRRRAKHQGILSLEYEVDGEDGDKAQFGDFIVGEDDIGYIDIAVDRSRLGKTEQEVYDLLVDGIAPLEIAKRLHISHQRVYAIRRKLRLWRE